MKKAPVNTDRIFTLIKQATFNNVFNPYIQNCSVHDHEKSCIIREENLRVYFHQLLSMRTKVIWVGRDLGYRGGRRTGIPLTDEYHLGLLQDCLGSNKIKKATTTEIVKEMTAKEIWKMAPCYVSLPFFWNVFPFHPHDRGDEMSNRSHTKDEFESGFEILKEIIDVFHFKHFFALGRDAYSALTKMGLDPVYVRHPSHGGQREFQRLVKENTPKALAKF